MGKRETLIEIAAEAVRESAPDSAVRRALRGLEKSRGRTILVAVGKAGWEMARVAVDELRGEFAAGYVITKYGHSKGGISGCAVFEAGHPLPDGNSVAATEAVLRGVEGLDAEDRVLLLLSGGGSALFEKPLVPLDELARISDRLLACGADIIEINTVRKRLSAVKGGRFARRCMPASVYSIILSDVIGDRPDMIASGPACPDQSTCADVSRILDKYGLDVSGTARALLMREPIKELPNASAIVTGGVGQLCASAKAACERRGYPAEILTDCLCCEAREAGTFLGDIARYHAARGERRAFVAGGETVVHLKGDGRGGRNQELALSAAARLEGLPNAALISVGSDGTDGPTDAAGGVVDGDSASALTSKGLSIYDVLERNDAYNGLLACDGLVKTGATGTNVNDVAVVLIDGADR